MRRAILALGALLAMPVPAHAEIALVPDARDVRVLTGAETAGSFFVTNAGPRAIDARLTPVRVVIQEHPASTTYHAGKGEAAWLRTDPEDVSLESGARRTVRYVVTVPCGTRPGVYRAGVYVEPSDHDAERKAIRLDLAVARGPRCPAASTSLMPELHRRLRSFLSMLADIIR